MDDLELTQRLLDWYHAHHRELPWRIHPDPYAILVSEIMLQQTRMETVLPYFERFIQQLPTIESLASVEEDVLFKLWEGLGYYRRASNLKRAALMVMQDYKGIIPRQKAELMTLPGIGDYTAGAIASTAFQQREIAIDGNVKRVVARVFDLRELVTSKTADQQIRTIVMNHMPEHRPGDYNQALMELGALVCLPNGVPLCDRCPWRELCATNITKAYDHVPSIPAKKPRQSTQKTILILQFEDMFFLKKRPAKGLLSNLWEFITLDGELSVEQIKSMLIEQGIASSSLISLPKRKHVFTHVEWHMSGYLVILPTLATLPEGRFITLDQLTTSYSVPSAFQGYLGDLISKMNRN